MPKLVKSKGYYLSQEEYDSIIKEGDKFLLPISNKILTDEEKRVIDEKIKAGVSRPQICRDLKIDSDSIFNNYLQEKYQTRKISEAKTKALLENK